MKLPVAEAALLGLPVLRDWMRCTHPARPLGDYVCPCFKPVGCGPACPGFEEDS